MGAEKELGFSGRIAINEYGVDKFNDFCRSSVMKYSHNWEKYVNRQARWVDFKNSYKTMDTNYMESVLWAFYVPVVVVVVVVAKQLQLQLQLAHRGLCPILGRARLHCQTLKPG